MAAQKDFISRYFEDLKTRDREQQLRCVKAIRVYIEAEARNTPAENFTKFMNDVFTRIFEIVNSDDPNLIMGGVMLIDELINVQYCQYDETNVIKFASYLRWVLKPTHSDLEILRQVAKTLGHLVRTGGPLTAEIVETEVKRALEWLEGSSYEFKRHAAVLVLRELAENAPTLFNVHVSTFLDHIWVALRDPKLAIREGAVHSVRACLALISKRDTRQRVQWYFQIYGEAQKGFKNGTPESIHGSLLTIGELLSNSGEFMLARFKEVCETVLKYQEHRDRMVRKTVIALLPRLAIFCPDAFVRGYLDDCIRHIFTTLKTGNHREVAFVALGETAKAVGEHILEHLKEILELVKEGLTPKGRRGFSNGALKCVAMLAAAVGKKLKAYMNELIDLMFKNGLNETLIDTLTDLTKYIPELLPVVQERLAETVSKILQAHSSAPEEDEQKSFKSRKSILENFGQTPRSSSAAPSKSGRLTATESPAKQNAELITLALRTLGSFDLHGQDLLPFVRKTVASFLDSDDVVIRKEATITCSRLLLRVCSNGHMQRNQYHTSIIAEIIERLLTVGIADSDAEIRQTVLSSLDPSFDRFLAQADNLQSLFIALNDEVFRTREVAMTVIGRLAVHNPAYVMPALRKTLIQLLTELQFSKEPKNREESSQLLGHLIGAAQTLVKPYVAPILNVLLPKLKDPDARVASCVLETLGKLAIVGESDMKPYLDDLLPLIVDTLQDKSSMIQGEVALRTLGQLVESTGSVIQPYTKYKNLLPTVLNTLKGDHSWEVRREAIRVLGILGALDPYRHKLNQVELQDSENTDGTSKPLIDLHPASVFHPGVTNMSTSSEEYYPTVAINALMEILKEPGLGQYHNMVIQAVMFIFKSLGLKCVPFLPQIIPPFLQVLSGKNDSNMPMRNPMEHNDDSLRESLFHQLSVLVSIVKQHIRNYLEDIFKLIHEYWHEASLLPMILCLVEEISLALKDEFKVYVPDLVPQLLDVLHSDRSDDREPTIKVLHALETFGSNLDDHLFLIIHPLVRLCEQIDIPMPVRKKGISTIGQLCKSLNFSSYTSRIIHPLARIMDGPIDELRQNAMHTLCCLLFQLGSDYTIFVPMVDKIIKKHGLRHPQYHRLVSKLLKNEPFLESDFSFQMEDQKEHEGKFDETMSQATSIGSTVKKLAVNQQNLKKAWEASQRSTKEDWMDWMRCFSVELLKESPSPALRACSALAQKYSTLARELFNAAFISCWTELYDQYQDDLVRSLESAFKSAKIPPEVLQTLLNLAEFMEHDDKALPIDIRTLGNLAENCHSFAKALHYKEIEFRTSPNTTIEALISINNQLQQPEAAVGILEYAQLHHSVELKESWYEKLQRWEDALEAYERKQLEEPSSVPLTLGRMRCLRALGEWERLAQLSHDLWQRNADMAVQKQVAPLAAASAWNLGRWDSMDTYVSAMEQDFGVDSRTLAEGSFFRAIAAVHRNQFNEAARCINHTRQLLDSELTALVGESYNRAYRVIIKVQQLTELEEVISYKQCNSDPTRARIRKMWSERLNGCQHNVEVWQQLLSVRSLVVKPKEDIPTWLKFSSLCRKSNRLSLSLKVLTSLLGVDPTEMKSEHVPLDVPVVSFAYLKHLWSAGFQEKALGKLRHLVDNLDDSNMDLRSRCFLKLGFWQRSLRDQLDSGSIAEVLNSYEMAKAYDPKSYKAWHAWALMNYQVVQHYEGNDTDQAVKYLVPAITGFFKSVALDNGGQGPDTRLQDVLRLLNLWFKYGSRDEVETALITGFEMISIDTWLSVIPQIIARIHMSDIRIRKLIHDLLTKVGNAHPQALIYPLTVASKSVARKAAANSILDKMRVHTENLVEQALLVSQELIRIAILWHEMWHEALEEASRLYFGNGNIEGMFATLAPVHEMMEKGPDTIREVAFQQAFGRDLQEAHEWCKKYNRSGKDSDLNQAWELYCHVFRKINKQLPQLTELELQYVSPKLLEARDLEIAVPGTYYAGQPLVRIKNFEPSLRVIDSKQRPRKLTIYGSDGIEYAFLLKGHEDLRQDERVMQLFGLVNTLLAHDRDTSKRDLSIKRYSVIPLAPNSGLIEWLPHCDTLHSLIKEYRDARKILLNIEHRLILQMAPDYQHLTLIQKVEVFEYALSNTTGQDLYKVLWLKSENSETWLDRRTNYTRSLAVMSMVGYILGLGDRHPCNLMLDRRTGKLIHIDFGDCFEVAMHREKYPEKVPFRLTRMLINAMEVSGIEGNFRSTCESVMRVLRENKESVMAVLEAFVYDPLINWRLLQNGQDDARRTTSPAATSPKRQHGPQTPEMKQHDTSELTAHSRKDRGGGDNGEEHDSEVLNEKALSVINRVSNKLTGKDFDEKEILDVPAQVRRLILQATSYENLCQCYIGWCPLW